MWWFEYTLLSLILFCSALVLIGLVNRAARSHFLIKHAFLYLPIFLVVFVIRAFIFQPFKVVSGSLEPTVMIGDFIGVNQSAYGIRLPLSHKKIFNTGSPKLGDIALFYYPVDQTKIYVKRVIGTPGDHVIYQDKKLTINGKLMPQMADGMGFDVEPKQKARVMNQRIEVLDGIKHRIFVDEKTQDLSVNVIVPPNKYFMMGDNRDNSGDSRYWGFVDDSQLIGKALRILISWDSEKLAFRTSRIGSKFSL